MHVLFFSILFGYLRCGILNSLPKSLFPWSSLCELGPTRSMLKYLPASRFISVVIILRVGSKIEQISDLFLVSLCCCVLELKSSFCLQIIYLLSQAQVLRKHDVYSLGFCLLSFFEFTMDLSKSETIRQVGDNHYTNWTDKTMKSPYLCKENLSWFMNDESATVYGTDLETGRWLV